MGDYMSMRFKGVVKPIYRDLIAIVNNTGDWDIVPIASASGYAGLYRASFIPCGSMSYPPSEWMKESEYLRRSFNEETGEWIFQCSIKSGGEYQLTHDEEIKLFMNEIVPVICEKVENFELWHEYWDYPVKYNYTPDDNGSLQAEPTKVVVGEDGSWHEVDGANGKTSIKCKSNDFER